MHKAIVLLLPALLASCAGGRFAPLEGMPAAIGETVRVGPLTATPVRLIQAGRLIVSTRLEGEGWRRTVPLALGEPYAVAGSTVTLVSGRPEKWNDRRRPRNEYRFVFESGV